MNAENANYYLKDPEAKGATLIYLIFRYRKLRFKYSTGKKVAPAQWNEKRQRMKAASSGATEFNSFLDALGDEVVRLFNHLSVDGVPTPETLRNELAKFGREVKSEEGVPFFQAWDEFMTVKKDQQSHRTVQRYLTLENQLRDFEKQHKYKLAFDKMDGKFYDLLYAFYTARAFVNNTIGKYVSSLKTFLHWEAERGYHSQKGFVKFKAPKEEADIIYLTWEELMRVLRLDLTQNPKLERVRDVFCLGCFTGQRYSDLAAMKPNHIRDNRLWVVKTMKTRDQISVPLNEYAREIINRYKDAKGFLPVISNPKTNDYLKELGKLAEINSEVTITRYRGAERLEATEPKYKFLTSHTARRTFVTLSLEKGMRPEVVMTITGHKDYATFKKYIKITEKVTQAEMLRVWSLEPTV